MLELLEKSKKIFIQTEKIEPSFSPELMTDFNIHDMAFNSTNDENFEITPNLFLNKKKEKYLNENSKEKHTKFSYDNLKRECKHLVIENILIFINNKIFEVYEGNIGKGLLIKKLYKLNQTQKLNADVEFNKIFITKTLREILSQNISKRFKLLEKEHNKNLIDKLIEEKKDIFEKIFNITFIECVEHFIGDKKIEELNGLTLFSELKEQIIKKNLKDGESYYENLRLFFKQFENKINRAKSRKKRKKYSSSEK